MHVFLGRTLDSLAIPLALHTCRLACVASLSVGFGSKDLQGEFLALSPFSALAKHQKSRSLLPNPTETLASQATCKYINSTDELILMLGVTHGWTSMPSRGEKKNS